jgi:hypothetical protein
VDDPAGLYATSPENGTVIETGVSKSSTFPGDPTSRVVPPNENPDGVVPVLEVVFGGSMLPFHPLGPKIVVPSGMETDVPDKLEFDSTTG